MPGATVSLGQRVTEIGALQLQINALMAEIASGQFVPITLGSPFLSVGQPVAADGGLFAHAIAGLNNGEAAIPIGVVVPQGDGVQIQTAGIVTLTTDEWDAVTTQIGGLTAGSYYFCGIGGADGALTADEPIGALVGWALSSTELVLRLGTPPATISGNPGITTSGQVVTQSSTVLAGAIASSLGGCDNAVGIVIFAVSTKNIVAVNGNIATLATAVWDSVTGGSGGLTEGAIYYVSAATAGHLVVTNAPSGTGDFALGVGVALSATQLLVHIGTPIGPHA
jgi:hypothetical protein